MEVIIIGKKFTYEEVRKYIENLGYILISKEYINNNTKLILKDYEDYLYFANFISLSSYKMIRLRFHKANPYTIDNIKLWLKLNNFDLELISEKYENAHKYLLFKTKEGYLCIAKWNSIQQKEIPRKFHRSNPYTIQNIKLWCKLNNKSFELLSDTYKNNIKKLKWKCLKDNCKEEFEADWNSIFDGGGCPYCHGLQVGLSNNLANIFPDIANQWHPTKNGNLTPYDVTYSSNKYVWWQCDKGHEWYISINTRVKNNCPYCSGFYPTKENNLLINNPELCEEWDYNKNNKRPEDYTPRSSQYAMWKCKECGHEWRAKISDRNGKIKSGCPECKKSKGEKKISNDLISKGFIKISQEEFDKLVDKYNEYYFIPQKTFNGLLGLGGKNLLCDFYLPRLNLIIEYDGEFHFRVIKNYKKEPIKYAKERYKKQQIHDIRKNKYAMDNNIDLLRIPYWEFNNLEEILNYYIKI